MLFWSDDGEKEGEGRACEENVKFVDLGGEVGKEEGFERIERVVVKVRWVRVWGVRKADLEDWEKRIVPRAEEVERVVRNILDVGRVVWWRSK